MTMTKDTKLSEVDPAELAEAILGNGARSAMGSAIGDRTSRQYDKADEIAEGIARGVRNTLDKLKEASDG